MSTPAPPAGPTMDERIAERRAAVSRDRRRRRGRWRGLVALAALVAAVAAVIAAPLLSVMAVEVTGVSGGQAREAREAADIATGDHLLRVDTGAAAAAVAQLPWVAEAEVVRVPPATVEIRVRARRPLAVVRLADASWTVDRDGVVLAGGVAGQDLVEVLAPGATLPGPGRRAEDEAVTGAVAFHTALPEDFAGRVRRYRAEDPMDLRMEVETADGALWVRVGAPEEAALKAEVVAALLGEEAVAGAQGGYELDVRAPESPVLVPSGD